MCPSSCLLKYFPKPRLLLLTPLLALSLSACGPNVQPDTAPKIDPDIARAELLLAQEDPLAAAELYRNLALRHPEPRKSDFLLLAAEAAVQAGDLSSSGELLLSLNDDQLNAAQRARRNLLQAELWLQAREIELALNLLRQTTADELDLAQQRRYFRHLADAYRQTGNLLESAKALQAIDARLSDPQDRLMLQSEILRSLILLNEFSLSALQPAPPSVAGGWMQLALLFKRHGDNRIAMTRELAQWQQTYPNHPAMSELFERYQQRLAAQIERAQQIGILLPQSGRFAGPANALRDGLLAQWHKLPAEQRPALRFYDSSDVTKAWPLYAQAIEEGAEAIIGPLQKDALIQFARAGELPVPVLALNQVETDSIPPANLFMFALSPEGEARQAAERIWLDDLRAPMLLVPDNDWGQRIARAFDDRWRTLGGEAIDQRAYDPSSSDYSAAITSLLHVDSSKARHRQLQQWLGERLEFEPRRRADADAFFIAAYPAAAQSIPPQLQFHLAGDLPVYATSHAWNGELSNQQLADMRGLILSDIPLISQPEQRAELAKDLPGIEGPLVRLYAMGMDAMRLLPHLRRLQSNSFESLDGETGNLFLDPENRIQRQTVWMKLAKRPKVLGYAARLDLQAPMDDMPIAIDPQGVPTAPAINPATHSLINPVNDSATDAANTTPLNNLQ